MDLPVWQALWQELHPKGLEIVSVTEDSKGWEVARPIVEAAGPDYPVLLDRQHVIAERYGTRNVPAGVWIDERGRIVRGPEVASAAQRNPETNERVPHEKYHNALRDWVARGAQSIYVQQGRRPEAPPTGSPQDAALAAAEFRLGLHLQAQGGEAAYAEAVAHFKRAHELSLENWNYKRQAWNLGDAERDYGTTMQREREKGIPMHAPLDLPDLPG